jgi:ubiquinone/menaquinone biosynthesis C-methylase UbiE
MNSLLQLFAEVVLPQMELSSNERVVDLGCGDGWACRSLAAVIPEGLVIGLDASNDLVRNARAKSVDFENIIYIWGNAEQIPWQADFFTAGLCIDSLAAFADPLRSLRELHRVLVPCGRVWMIASDAASARDYARLLAEAGFDRIESSAQPLHGAVADAPPPALLFTARKHDDTSVDASSENSNGKK